MGQDYNLFSFCDFRDYMGGFQGIYLRLEKENLIDHNLENHIKEVNYTTHWKTELYDVFMPDKMELHALETNIY